MTVGGNHASREFAIDGGVTAVISGLTITNGWIDGSGGGINNSGNLSLLNCTVSNNSAVGSGGLFGQSAFGGGINNTGTLSMIDCTVSGNAVSDTGNGGGIDNVGTFSMIDCTVSGNAVSVSSGSSGPGGGEDGGICNIGTFSIFNCTISGNSASNSGTVYIGFFRAAGGRHL